MYEKKFSMLDMKDQLHSGFDSQNMLTFGVLVQNLVGDRRW
jgi:hypothetical protein